METDNTRGGHGAARDSGRWTVLACGIALLASLMAGCTGRKVVRFDPGAGMAAPHRAAPDACFRYSQDAREINPFSLGEAEFHNYDLFGISFQSAGDNGQEGNLVEGRYYRSTLPGPKPLVIVLPVWGGSTYPPRTVTAHLLRASRGAWNVLWVLGERQLLEWDVILKASDEADYVARWRKVVDRDRVTVIDVRRIVDWAQSQRDLDGGRIGLVGFSHGAMLAALVATQEPRLAATVLVMGGAMPHAILTNCHYDGITAVRQMAIDRFGWSLSDYRERLREVFGCLDPAVHPLQADPSRVLLFDAGRDRCFPPEAREAVWEALGRPERLTIPYGHETSFLGITPLGLNWMRYRIQAFLGEAFQRPVGALSLDSAAKCVQAPERPTEPAAGFPAAGRAGGSGAQQAPRGLDSPP